MPTSPPYTVEQHITLGRVGAVAASPDGAWIAVAVQRLDRDGTSYVSDLWKLPRNGGPAVQLTRGDSKDTAPAFRHDGALAFLSNRTPTAVKPDDEADKRSQVWVLPAAGGEPLQLTDEPLGVLAFQCARRADRMALLSPVLAGVPHDQQRATAADRRKKGASGRLYARQPVRHWDHWLHQGEQLPNTHLVVCRASDATDRRDLTPAARSEFAIEPSFDLADDGAQVVITEATEGTDRELDSTLLVIDVASGAARRLGQAEHTNNESPRWSPDGRTLAAIRSTRSARFVVRPTLTLFDLASGALRPLATDWDRWPHLHHWTADGTALLVTADDAGEVPVFRVDVASGDVTRASQPGGSWSDVVPLPAGACAGIRSSIAAAPEAFVLGADGVPQALTPLAGRAAADWVEVEHIHVASTDGAPIHCVVTRPRGVQGRLPVLLWIHGGPIGMSGDGWHWRWNPLLAAAQGYMVVQPNPRGSTGFGQDFIQGIWGNTWGAQCYHDLMAVTDALEARADVDASRIMAMGGSFGGYMSNWIGTQTDRFRCIVTHASIVTMAQFTGVTDHPAWWYLEMGGENPYTHPDAFDRYAPIKAITQWKTPVLIIHGELDYRCPINEGLYLFEALQYHGVDAQLLVFPDENHWILKPRNIVAWYEHVLGFIGRHMDGPPA